MRAGQYIIPCEFYEPRVEQKANGSIETSWERVWRCKVWSVRFSNVTDKGRQDAGEAFFGSFGVIRSFPYPQIRDNQRVKMGGVWYQIILITPPRPDRSIDINITKLNE